MSDAPERGGFCCIWWPAILALLLLLLPLPAPILIVDDEAFLPSLTIREAWCVLLLPEIT
jgi:hypothetical protein